MLSIAFSSVNSLRAQATKASFLGLPAFLRRWYIPLSTGLWRMPVSAARYKAVRTSARPPHTERRPRRVPLSWLMGASPAKAAISRRLIWPSSGNSANRVKAVSVPTPGTPVNSWYLHWSLLECFTKCLIFSSTVWIWPSKKLRWRSIPGWRLGHTSWRCSRRLRSIPSMTSSCFLRVAKALKVSTSRSGKARVLGRLGSRVSTPRLVHLALEFCVRESGLLVAKQGQLRGNGHDA